MLIEYKIKPVLLLTLSKKYLQYKCVVAKLGSKARNFLSGSREIKGRDRDRGTEEREIEIERQREDIER